MSVLFSHRMPSTAQSAQRHLIVFDGDEWDNQKMTGRQLDGDSSSFQRSPTSFKKWGLLSNALPTLERTKQKASSETEANMCSANTARKTRNHREDVALQIKAGKRLLWHDKHRAGDPRQRVPTVPKVYQILHSG